MQLVRVGDVYALEYDGRRIEISEGNAEQIAEMANDFINSPSDGDCETRPTMEKYVTPLEAAHIFLQRYPGASGGDVSKLTATIRTAAWRGSIENVQNASGHYKLELLSFMEYYSI